MTDDERGRRLARLKCIAEEMDRLREEKNALCRGMPWQALPRECSVWAARMVMDETGCSAREAVERVRAWNDAALLARVDGGAS